MKTFIISAAVGLLWVCTGCKSLNKTQAETGRNNAGLNTLVADFKTNNTMAGALMDGLITGEAGLFISKRMDDEASEIEKMIPGAEVKRIGQGINITFGSGFLFKKNSAKIEGAAQENLEKLATFFNTNPNTKILIEGHTSQNGDDPKQSEDRNKKLSQQRAAAVSRFFQSKGVAAGRINAKWYGSTQPKYPNDSEANREKNRRVEIGLIADETFRKMAQEGKGQK
jgi:outer membrane protein OmpA-like peptidoglycan-associated protein